MTPDRRSPAALFLASLAVAGLLYLLLMFGGGAFFSWIL